MEYRSVDLYFVSIATHILSIGVLILVEILSVNNYFVSIATVKWSISLWPRNRHYIHIQGLKSSTVDILTFQTHVCQKT